MADDPNKPDFDPDKTTIDVSRGRGAHRAPEPEEDRTYVIGEDEDRTVVQPRAPRRPVEDADRTVVRGSGAAPAAAASAGASRFELVGLSGGARGRRFTVPEGEALIGSNPSCPIVIPGAEAVHARISVTASGITLQNLGTPGSIVLGGGRRLDHGPLQSGDLVRLGDVVLRFVQFGDVFASTYSESEFVPSGIGGVLASTNPKQRLLWIGGGVGLVFVLLLALWPSGPAPKPAAEAPKESKADEGRKKEIASLLAAGQVLFESGKLMAPSDRLDEENAFDKFNAVLSLDPGNEEALAWLGKIDEEQARQRTAREEAERRRREAEEARRARARQELEARVNAVVAIGDEYYDKGQVAEPAGSNALAKYREALTIDPESALARERVSRAVQYYVKRGDERRDANDPWGALENYRKGSRAVEGKDEEIEARIRETEARLRSGMSGAGSALVMYKDERGRLFVLDEWEKVPVRYRDRAVRVTPPDDRPEGGVRPSR